MNKFIKKAFEELRDEILDDIPASKFSEPLVWLDEKSGIVVGVALESGNRVKTIKLSNALRDAFGRDGWTDSEIEKAISETQKMLRLLEKEKATHAPRP